MKEFWVVSIGCVKVQAETKEEAKEKFWKLPNFPWNKFEQIQIDSIKEVPTNK